MAWGNVVGVASWLERLQRNDPSLTSVTVFRGRLFGPAEAAAVAEALRTNTHVTEFYASGHPMDPQTAGLFADMLAVNATIKSLCVGDQDFADAGLIALAPGLAASASLAAIDLENKGVGDEGARALGAALGGGGARSLTTINLARNDTLGETGVAAVCAGAAEGGILTTLTLAGIALTDLACEALGDLLASACPLKCLDLTDATGGVAGAGAARLATGLAQRAAAGNGLDALVLDGIVLGDAGAQALASTSPLSVHALSLQGCNIGEEGGIALARAVSAGGLGVEVLHLRDNAVGDAGAAALAGATTLKVLDVAANKLGAAGATELVARASDALKNLCIFGNEAVGNSGMADILEAGRAGGAAGLTVLDVGGCGVEEAGMLHMCEVLIKESTIFPALETLVVGGNPGVQGDAWEAALERLREARPGLDVAWRAADTGDDQQQRGHQLIEEYKQQGGAFPAGP